jgi:hypothetical protein
MNETEKTELRRQRASINGRLRWADVSDSKKKKAMENVRAGRKSGDNPKKK